MRVPIWEPQNISQHVELSLETMNLLLIITQNELCFYGTYSISRAMALSLGCMLLCSESKCWCFFSSIRVSIDNSYFFGNAVCGLGDRFFEIARCTSSPAFHHSAGGFDSTSHEPSSNSSCPLQISSTFHPTTFFHATFKVCLSCL